MNHKTFFNWGRNTRIYPKQIVPKKLSDLKNRGAHPPDGRSGRVDLSTDVVIGARVLEEAVSRVKRGTNPRKQPNFRLRENHRRRRGA